MIIYIIRGGNESGTVKNEKDLLVIRYIDGVREIL